MLRYHFRVTLRKLARQKLYGAIAIGGLTVGIAGCALILLFVRHELSYDRFHEGPENVYRVVVDMRSPDTHIAAPLATSAMAAALRENVPEVEAVGRLWRPRESTEVIVVGSEAYYEEFFFWCDQELFDVLNFDFVHGDPRTALADPDGIVLSESTARRYFANAHPIGQHLNEGEQVVTGVVRDYPTNSHLRFDVLAAAVGTKVDEAEFPQPWYDHSYVTYVRLRQGADPEEAAEQLTAIARSKVGDILEQMGHVVTYKLQPITEIHLHSDHLQFDIAQNGDIAHVYAFGAVAAFLLLLAVINFTNLATARSAERAMEVGIRKAVGAVRGQLVWQFLAEAVALSLLSLGAALVVMEMVTPWFNELTGMRLELDYRDDPKLLAYLVGMALLTGLCAGLYPAVQLSAFLPARVLTRAIGRSGRSGGIRSALVITQFTVSIGLIAATIIIGEQLSYLRSKALGFDTTHLVAVGTRAEEVRYHFESVRQDLLASPLVNAVGRCSQLPGWVENKSAIRKAGGADEATLEVTMLWVDYDFVDAMGMRVLEGRSFSREHSDDPTQACLVNETLAQMLSHGSVVGAELAGGSGQDDGMAKVVGVVADFHFESLHKQIDPLLIAMPANEVNGSSSPQHAVVRLAPGDPREGIEFIRRTLELHDDPFPLDYHFVDERLRTLYVSEEYLSRIFTAFAGLAVFLACLGVFGLVAFTTQQRTKEIGIRKVLGATAASVIALLTRDFARLILVANLLAWPAVYFWAERWLEGFAFRIQPGAVAFVAGGLMALTMAWMTVSYHAVRAGLANPVDSLRYE